MNKVIVIGCPGSGKSTFSIKLADLTGLPLVHLDLLNWNSDGTTVDIEVFLERQERYLKKESWIIDGNYGASMDSRFQACDTVMFLDYPLQVCLTGIENRRGKARPDMPWVEDEIDQEFIDFVKAFPETGREQIISLIDQFSDKKVYIFKNRHEADVFLEGLADCQDIL